MEPKVDEPVSGGFSRNITPSNTQPSQNLRPFTPVIYTQKLLYSRYSSSQHYFYSNKITEIVKQKCVAANIMFEDIQCLLDEEQYLKRQYHVEEYSRKLATFKQYYFYHEDCPRIFGNLGIAETYEKWHEKKRDYVYKKLKFMYNETYSSLNSSEKTIEDIGANGANVTHFLLDISQYNPYSKKYYLRVQARQQKQKQELQRQKQKNQSIEMYNNFNSDLSRMLNKINNDLSVLTVVEQTTSQERRQKQRGIALTYSRNGKIGISSPDTSGNHSRNSSVRLNFKKKQAQEIQLINQDGRDYTKSPQSRNKYLNIDTESSSEMKKLAKHKKNVSEMNKNQYQLHNNLQINENKVKSILLMSSLSNRNQELESKSKLKLLRFGDKNYQKRTPQIVERKYDKNPSPFTTNIKSYKSLQKLDRFTVNNVIIKQQIKINNQLKYSHSVSKLARISPTKEKNNQMDSLTKIIDKKLENRQISLKKVGWEAQSNNAEEFNDRRIMNNKGLPSYKSQRLQPSTSASITNFSLKQNIGKKIQSQQKFNIGLNAINTERKVEDILKNNTKTRQAERQAKSGKKNNIRISFKNSNNNFKLFNK